MTKAPTGEPGSDRSRVWNHTLLPVPGVYAVDPVHTVVGFAAHHLVVGQVRGRFERVAGTLMVVEDPPASVLEVTIESASISTLFSARDDDLRSARFLDASTHPTITYRSTGVVQRPRGEWLVLGALILRGVTRLLPLSVTRSQFGLVAELSKEAGRMLIGDDVALEIEAEATRQR